MMIYKLFFGITVISTCAALLAINKVFKICPSSYTSLEAVSSGGATVPKSPNITDKTKFKNPIDSASSKQLTFPEPPLTGSGADERFSYFLSSEDMVDRVDLLNKVQMSYVHHSLLTDLLSDKYSLMEKVDKVNMMIRQDLLASTVNGHGNQLRPATAFAGGLANDWKLSME